MKNNNLGYFNDSTLAAIQRAQNILGNDPTIASLRQIQREIDMMKIPMDGVYSAVAEYHRIVAPLTETVSKINAMYEPILAVSRQFESIYNDSTIAAIKSSAMAMKSVLGINFAEINSIAQSLSSYAAFSDSILENIDFEEVADLYENGEISNEDIAEEVCDVVKTKRFTPLASWDKLKKSKWFLAIRTLLIIIGFLASPVLNEAKEDALEAFGVNQFWEDSGIYEWLDELFGLEENEVFTEQEAKSNIDKAKVGNVSKQKRNDLLAKIKEIRTYIATAPQDENTANLLAYLSELEKDVGAKKYGLVFEEHREEIDEVLSTHTPVLTEDGSLFIDNGGHMNFLIEGDNLASLHLLEKTYKGKINVIYIDPPYNTGAKDWRYNNEFVDDSDSFRHSKWISWIKNRLLISRKLLCPTGIIVVTIDDYEVSTLKLLLDDVFGDENYLGTVVIRNNPSGRSTVRGLSINHEYALFYSSTPLSTLGRMEHSAEQKSRYDEKDDKGFFEWENFRKNGTDSDRKDRPKQFYPIYLNTSTEALRIPNIQWNDEIRAYDVLEETAENEIVLYPITKGTEKVWKYGLERTKSIIDELLVKKTKQGYELYRKKYLNTEGSLPRTWWDKPEYSARDNGTRTLTNLFGPQKVFDFPKAPEAVKDALIAANLKKDGIVLDFFAGSGTTGQATLELNAKDGGNRRFILCTNNENNICREVTYERIRRVIEKQNYQASLKYYKVGYIPVSERMYYEYADELLAHIRELVELENGINFTGNAKVGIVLTEDELAEFIANGEAFNKCRKLYMGHDLLPDEEQEELLRSRGIEISIIPDYYYRNLQEG